MRISNNYAQKQPNFSSLKSIKYDKDYLPDLYPKEISELLKTLKESKAFNEFFKQYDVDLYFKRENFLDKKYFSMKLDTTIQKPEGNNYNPILSFIVLEDNEKAGSTQYLINRLTQKIKNIEFSDIKKELDDSLKRIEDREVKETFNAKKNAMYKSELDNTTMSLLSKTPETPKKTFFEKLFGWLK